MKVFIVTKVAGFSSLTLLILALSQICFKNSAEITSYLVFYKMVNKCSPYKECTISTSSHTRINVYWSYFPNRRDVANFLEVFNTWWLFRTLRKDFRQIYWKCCDQWGQKKCVFKNSGRLDWAMVPVPCIHTNTSDYFCIDCYSLHPCYAHWRHIEWGLSVCDNC